MPVCIITSKQMLRRCYITIYSLNGRSLMNLSIMSHDRSGWSKGRMWPPPLTTTYITTHTRTQLFYGLLEFCPGLPRWAGNRKVKPGRWNQSGFTGARDSEWQWHQLGHVQICTLTQTHNHASISPLSFLQAGCPSCHPTNSVKALKAPIHGNYRHSNNISGK